MIKRVKRGAPLRGYLELDQDEWNLHRPDLNPIQAYVRQNGVRFAAVMTVDAVNLRVNWSFDTTPWEVARGVFDMWIDGPEGEVAVPAETNVGIEVIEGAGGPV